MNTLYKERNPHIIDQEAVKNALSTDPVALRIFKKNMLPDQQMLVGVRLNLNILKNTGVAVQTLHSATNHFGYKKNKGFYRGEVIGYAASATLKNVYFNVDQSGREKIAVGEKAKFAMASIDGELVSINNIEANTNGVEIKFNPKQTHLFVDELNQAIHFAEEVTIIGHRAYARGNIIYHTPDTAPKRAGNYPSSALLLEREETNKLSEAGIFNNEMISGNRVAAL